MLRIYTHENRLLVWNARNLLESNGFECLIRNEFAGGAIGDLAPIDAWPELWLKHDRHAEAAQKLLQDFLQPAEPAPDWRCQQCHETNAGSFEVCWNCGEPSSSS